MKSPKLLPLVLSTLIPWVCQAQTSPNPPSGLAVDDVPLPAPSPSASAQPPEVGPFIERVQTFYALGDRSVMISRILQAHTPLARATDPWGLRSTGEIAPNKQAVIAEQTPRPVDKFDDAVAALKIPMIAFSEGWAMVNGVELYVGDTLVLTYEGTEVRATLTSISPTQLVFQAPDGRSHVRTIQRPDLADLAQKETPVSRGGDDFSSFRGVSREVGPPKKK